MEGNFRKEEEKQKAEISAINVVCPESMLVIALVFPKFLQFHTHLNVIYSNKIP